MKKSEISTSKMTIDESLNSKIEEKMQKIFVFSQPCVFKDISYKPGDVIRDEILINELLSDLNIKSKGQLNTILGE